MTQINANLILFKIKAPGEYLNLIICVNLRHLRNLRSFEAAS